MGKGKRNKARRPPPAKRLPDKNNPTIVQQEYKAEQFQGPLPPPQILAGYEQLLPGAADRILAMAEKETAHRHMLEEKSLDAEIEGLKNEAGDTKRGQYCGLAIGIIAIVSGAYTATNGAPWPGGFIGTGGVVALVSAFIVGRNNPHSNNGDQQSKEVVPYPDK
ncbi:MAG: DUF2335 domain-containing protein [Desulfobacteraceae bacterium]|nr:DUF2335 domain-containing protein [Desulfobacteraceae bacterium]